VRLDDRKIRHPSACHREPARPETHLQATAGSNDISVLSKSWYGRSLSRDNSRVEGGIFLDDARAERLVDLSGSSVSGEVDLNQAHIERDLNLNDAQVEMILNANALQVGGAMHMRSDQSQSTFHDVSLIGAKVVGDLEMVGLRVDGVLNAYGLKVGGTVVFRSDVQQGRQASVSGAVTFEGAHIERDLIFNDAQVEKTLNANALQVDGTMHMRSDQSQSSFHPSFDDVSLIGAKVVGDVDMVGVRVNGILNAHALQVGGSLVLRSGAKARQAVYGSAGSGTAIDLTSAKVAGNVDMDGVAVNGPFDAANLQVGESLLMRSDGKYVATLHEIFLGGAKIDGNLDMTGALFGRDVVAQGLGVGGDVSMREIYSDRSIEMPFARFNGNLDLGGANLAHLNLRGASIAGEMRLGDRSSMVGWLSGSDQPEDADRESVDLDLRDVHVGGLSDNRYSWPSRMHLAGFSFARVTDEMVARGALWWKRNWIGRDNDISFSPYEQLAAVFTAAGDNFGADDFRFDKYVLQDKTNSSIGVVGSWFLRNVAGYGLRSYSFLAVDWAFILILLGAVVLKFSVKGVAEANHGVLWCMGASANRLLPSVINIKKEFADFFDNPAQNQFTPWQDFFFSVLALLGVVLGGFVITALAGLAHTP
jgi:hypothetical protein